MKPCLEIDLLEHFDFLRETVDGGYLAAFGILKVLYFTVKFLHAWENSMYA